MQLAATHRSSLPTLSIAVRDVRNRTRRRPTVPAHERFYRSPMLSYWCEIAGIDLNCVIDRARTLMTNCDAGRRWCQPLKSLNAQGAETCHPHSAPHRDSFLKGAWPRLCLTFLCTAAPNPRRIPEMPGLQLTASLAQCLSVSIRDMDAALAALLNAKFLSRTRRPVRDASNSRLKRQADFRNRPTGTGRARR